LGRGDDHPGPSARGCSTEPPTPIEHWKAGRSRGPPAGRGPLPAKNPRKIAFKTWLTWPPLRPVSHPRPAQTADLVREMLQRRRIRLGPPAAGPPALSAIAVGPAARQTHTAFGSVAPGPARRTALAAIALCVASFRWASASRPLSFIGASRRHPALPPGVRRTVRGRPVDPGSLLGARAHRPSTNLLPHERSSATRRPSGCHAQTSRPAPAPPRRPPPFEAGEPPPVHPPRALRM